VKFLVSVPLEIHRQLSLLDPDVRSITRIPGFIRLEQEVEHEVRFTLTFEVEAGSRRDAVDASDELMVEFENALSAYRPRQLAAAATETT